MPVPVLLRAEAILYGHLDNLPDDNGAAHPLGVPCFGMPSLPADHVHHSLETLAVIQPAQYKRGGQGHTAFSQALSEMYLILPQKEDGGEVASSSLCFL